MRAADPTTGAVQIANDLYSVAVDASGRLTSLVLKEHGRELVAEPRLAAGFRIAVPRPENLALYTDESEQDMRVLQEDSSILLEFESLSVAGEVCDISGQFRIALDDREIRFTSEITNRTKRPLAEIWFPRLGGLQGLFERAGTEVVAPGYTSTIRPDPFRKGFGWLGNEYPFVELGYPGALVMPWLSLYDRDGRGALYVAEQNPVQRRISFVLQQTPGYHGTSGDDDWPYDHELSGSPVGVVLSKVSYPHTRHATFTSGAFVVRAHSGDWHDAAKLYREWFLSHFALPDKNSWLRREQAWFTTVLQQPEDRVVTDLDGWAEWMADAKRIGISVGELIGWDIGGLERDYPRYEPDPKVGGWSAYRRNLQKVQASGSRVLTFVNYQVLDACTDWFATELHRYRRMDSFGQTENWMAWGESTLRACKSLDVRRHVPASVAVPGFTELLDGYLTKLVEAGTDGLQIDKLVVAGQLDFNPGHDRDPDLPMCEDLVQAIGAFYEQARRLNPDFYLAAEAGTDRFLSFADVFYRAASIDDISPLRFAFPEWTACVHVSSPFDFVAVNAAVMLGAVIVVEPFNYTRSIGHPEFAGIADYLKRIIDLRSRYLDRIFLADYLDTRGARLDGDAATLDCRVHARYSDGKRAVVVINRGREAAEYVLGTDDTMKLIVVEADDPDGRSYDGGAVTLAGERLHLFLER